jgi:hypothetical protein
VGQTFAPEVNSLFRSYPSLLLRQSVNHALELFSIHLSLCFFSGNLPKEMPEGPAPMKKTTPFAGVHRSSPGISILLDRVDRSGMAIFFNP